LKAETISTETTIDPDVADPVAVISTEDNDSTFAELSANLAEIRKLKGVTGYILRSNTSAIIDIAEQDKIIDYAIMTTQIHESSQEIAKQFNIPEVESVLVENKNLKILCKSLGENHISLFMDASAAHAKIIRKFLF
jgi:predicted regulator of Ras-like GTPase activity (Roadblock/LC7/MglB family)